jgi:methylthioribose-1-phosphate isomerase
MHSRPTAVNLADSAAKLKSVARKVAAAAGATPEKVTAEVVKAAEATLEDDVAANKVQGVSALGLSRRLRASG